MTMESANNIICSPRNQLDEDAEKELGRLLEALWDEQEEDKDEPSLTDPQKRLNSCLEKIPVTAFPATPNDQVIEINSDASLEDAVQLLAKHRILSAPVRDIEADERASWIDKYMGIVEFAGIVVWLLHQSEIVAGSTGAGIVTGAVAGTTSSATLGGSGVGAVADTTEMLEAVTGSGPANSSPEAVSATGADFFELLTSSELYRKTKVKDIAGSFRWAPFLPIQKSDSFLTMLLLLSKYRMKSLPVVDIGETKIDNIITQSTVMHMLSKCIGLPWFETWGKKTLLELNLPVMKADQMVKVNEDEPVLKAFKLMSKKGVGGIPVIEKEGNRPVGNISLRDVQFLLMAPEIYKDSRSVTAKDFLTAVRTHLHIKQDSSSILGGVIACQKNDTIEDIILKLDNTKIQRIYVVNGEGDLEGVVTLRDIISKFVQEPPGYFGDFFYGVVPSPGNSRV